MLERGESAHCVFYKNSAEMFHRCLRLINAKVSIDSRLSWAMSVWVFIRIRRLHVCVCAV